MKYFENVFTCRTEYSADSVEWCRVAPYQHYLACGTYQLNENGENRRVGQVNFFLLDAVHCNLKLVQTIDTHAVLDMKWNPNLICGKAVLAVATSRDLQVWYIKDGDGTDTCQLNYLTKYPSDDEALVLSVDWCTCQTNLPRICFSDSKGRITILCLNGDKLLSIISYNSHQYEAWVAAFDYFNHSVVYTGGDDCCMKIYDTREGGAGTRINRQHGAGVTAIRCSNLQEYTLASGSYDELIRIWDTRQMNSSVHELNVGGGIWRIKWFPEDDAECLVVAAMYNGFHKLRAETKALQLVSSCISHESIAYGVDVCPRETHCTKDTNLVATCSFYDKKLCLSWC